jgi:hypothetical protein
MDRIEGFREKIFLNNFGLFLITYEWLSRSIPPSLGILDIFGIK